MASTSDLEHFRALLKEETQQLREELRRDISEIRQSEQPPLERLLSGNRGQVMPPELIRWGEGFGGSVGVRLGVLWVIWRFRFAVALVSFLLNKWCFCPDLFCWWDAGPSAPHCFPDLGLGMSPMEITHRRGQQALRSTTMSCSNGIGILGRFSRGATAALPATAFGVAEPRADTGTLPTARNALATVCSLHRRCLRMELQNLDGLVIRCYKYTY